LAVDLAEEWGDAREVGYLSEEAAYFRVWIFAGLEAAEKFQDKLLFVKDGGVRLLGRAGTCRQ
jgi:hypothetical protein